MIDWKSEVAWILRKRGLAKIEANHAAIVASEHSLVLNSRKQLATLCESWSLVRVTPSPYILACDVVAAERSLAAIGQVFALIADDPIVCRGWGMEYS